MATTASHKPKSRFPWYKERLKWKYIQKLDDYKLCWNKWQFLPNNADDFRTGLPVKQQYKRSKRCLAPPIFNCTNEKSLRPKSSKEDAAIPRHDSTVYSRTGPRILRQKSQVEEAESGLQEHPLGLYPHLEDSIPAEISDEVVTMLDPSLRPELSSFEDSLMLEQIVEGAESDTVKSSIEEAVDNDVSEQLPEQGRIYCFPLKKSEEEELLEAMLASKQNAVSLEQEQAVESVMKDLVQWGMKLDDGNNCISESTIKKLFASSYETKSLLTAPIHVMELTSSIPNELRPESRGYTPYTPTNEPTFGLAGCYKPSSNDTYLPKTVKGKYGAWYLDINLWKYRPCNEPLQDPNELDEIKDAAKKAKNLMLDNALMETHGAIAFKNFIVSKQQRSVPKFLRGVNSTTPRNRTK